MLNQEQRQLIKYTKAKVRALFLSSPAKGHDFNHIKRVAKNAVEIAKKEKANVFICELAGWLHDVGRTKETEVKITGWAHHEWSYEICRDWFKNDINFSVLSDEQKLEILYDVKYHWNIAADKYPSAVILRDADKLDALGKNGIKRLIELAEDDDIKMSTGLRFTYDMYVWIRTETAKKMVIKKNLMKPVEKYYKKYLKNKITPVRL